MVITPQQPLRAQYFNCRQGSKQSLRSFSLQIRELFIRLKGRRDHGLGDGDMLLRDQFLMGLQDGPIRQGLRLQLHENPDLTFEDIRKEALALELDQLETAEQPTCMATNSASAPTPPPVVNWKQELRAEIMKDVEEQMAELSKTLLDELRRSRPSGPPFPRERSYSEGAREQERRSGRPPGSRFQWAQRI